MPIRCICRLVLLALAACALPAVAQEAVSIRIDPGQRFQTMTGWEATPDTPDNPSAPAWADWHDQALDLAVAAGITRIRLEIRAGVETRSTINSDFIAGRVDFDGWKGSRYDAVNDNDDPFDTDPAGFDFAEIDWVVRHTVLPLRDRVAGRGQRLFINLCYVSFRSGPYVHKDPEEYAEFVLATYRHLDETFGIVADSWEVILEPDLPEEGWTGTQIGQAIVATARRLQEAGYTAAFVVPSVTDMRNTVPYLDQIAAVPGALDHVSEISYHRYKGQRSDAVLDIARRGADLGLPTAMLELWQGRASYNTLFDDLTRGNVSSWQNRMLEGMYSPGEDGTLAPKGEVRFTAPITALIDPGAVRIDATSTAPLAADAVAFVNTDGRQAIALRARGPVTVTLTGIAPGRYAIGYALQDGQMPPETRAPDGDGTLTLTIPAKGIVTLDQID